MKKISRRNMVKGTAAAAAAWNFQVVPSRVFGANSKLTLGAIGTGGKGGGGDKCGDKGEGDGSDGRGGERNGDGGNGGADGCIDGGCKQMGSVIAE